VSRIKVKANNGNLFCKHFFHKFREEPLASQAVRALVIDMKKEIPRIVISIKPGHKNQGHFKQYDRISKEPFFISFWGAPPGKLTGELSNV